MIFYLVVIYCDLHKYVRVQVEFGGKKGIFYTLTQIV